MKNRTVLFVLIALSAIACQKVPAGNVGVKVYLLGSNKGVDVEELTPGRYWIGINEELYLFPTFTQTYTWEAANNEHIGFQTVEGLGVNADVGITYKINPAKATEVFQKYRRGVEEITDLYLRNMVRDSLVKNASTMSVEAVYGAGKADLIDKVQADVKRQVEGLGIEIEKVNWIGEIRIPEIVQAAIGNKIKATQVAQQRENEIAQARAESDIQIAQARGIAESKLTQARADSETIELKAAAESKAIELKGAAEAKAIDLKGRALRDNPALVELTQAERWNGALPQMTGGVIPFMQIPSVR